MLYNPYDLLVKINYFELYFKSNTKIYRDIYLCFIMNEKNQINFDYVLRIVIRILIIILATICLRIVDLVQTQYVIFNGIVKLIIISIIVQNISRIATRTIIFLYIRSKKQPLDFEDLFTVGLKHIFTGIKTLLLFLIALYLFGIDLNSFFTSISLIGVAIAILFKDFISNMLNGMYLFFSEKFDIKQYVEINGVKGIITDISFQAIEMKNDSNDFVYIPNSSIQTSEIINYSKESLKQIIIEVSLLKDEIQLIEKIEKTIRKKVVENYSEILSKKDPLPIKLEFKEILPKQLSITFRIVTTRYSFQLEKELKQFTYKKISEILIKHHSNKNSYKSKITQ